MGTPLALYPSPPTSPHLPYPTGVCSVILFVRLTRHYITLWHAMRHATRRLQQTLVARPLQVMPMIKAVAHNFVTERCPGEVMALGINSIREVMRRVPAVLEEDGMDVLVVVSRLLAAARGGDLNMFVCGVCVCSAH